MSRLDILVVDAEETAAQGQVGGLSTRDIVNSYRQTLEHDYGDQVSIEFVDWPRLREEHDALFLVAHKHRQRGEELPYVYVDDRLYWTGGLSLRDIMKELDARGIKPLQA